MALQQQAEDKQMKGEFEGEGEQESTEVVSDTESVRSNDSLENEEEESQEEEEEEEEDVQQKDNNQGVMQGPLSSCRGESWAVDWMKGVQNMGLTFSIPGVPVKQVVSLSYSQAQRLLQTITSPIASLKVGKMIRKPEGNLATILADGQKGLLQLSMGLTGDLQLVYKEMQEIPTERRAIDIQGLEFQGGQMIVAEQLLHMAGIVSDQKIQLKYLSEDVSQRSFSLKIFGEQPWGESSGSKGVGGSTGRITLQHLSKNRNQPPSETFYFWIAESNLAEGKQELEKIINLLKKPPTLAQQSGLPERKLRELQIGLENAQNSSKSVDRESMMQAATVGRTDLDTLEQLGASTNDYFSDQNNNNNNLSNSDEDNVFCSAAASVSGLLTNDAIGRSCKVSVTTYVSFCFSFSGDQRKKKKTEKMAARVVRRRSGLIVQDLVRKIGSRRLQSIVAETFVNFRSSLINPQKRTRVTFNLAAGKTDGERRALQRRLIGESMQIVQLSKGQFNRGHFKRAMTQLKQINFSEEKVRLLLQACAPQIDYSKIREKSLRLNPVDSNFIKHSRLEYIHEWQMNSQRENINPNFNIKNAPSDRQVRKVVKVEDLDSFVQERVKRLESQAD